MSDYHKTLFQVPKVSLGFFPTPLQRLNRLSDRFGCEIYIKRDDFTGRSLFGGNKVRKLEYLMADAAAKGCDTVITYGATQSNHAMETVTAARICGLKPIVYLHSLVEPDPEDLRANLLLDHIYGAEVHIVPLNGSTLEETKERSQSLARERIAELESQGHKCYNIPGGGFNGVGAAAYIAGYQELSSQLEKLGISMQYLFSACGSGGTLAGLAAGKKLLGSQTEVIGIQSGKKDSGYKARIAKTANDALDYIGQTQVSVSEDDFICDDRYYGEGYEIPSEKSTAAIKLLARQEGILLDPVYTGKGFSGMIDYLENGAVPKGSTVVFLHTGGTTALFSEHKIVGPLAE